MYKYKHYAIDTVDDGEYEAEIIAVDSGRSTPGPLTVYWVLKIAGGLFDGKLILLRFPLSTTKSVQFHKNRLNAFGVNVANRIEFANKKDRLVGRRARVTASTNDQGYPSYFATPAPLADDLQVDPELEW